LASNPCDGQAGGFVINDELDDVVVEQAIDVIDAEAGEFEVYWDVIEDEDVWGVVVFAKGAALATWTRQKTPRSAISKCRRTIYSKKVAKKFWFGRCSRLKLQKRKRNTVESHPHPSQVR
jgi:hypothetical protein